MSIFSGMEISASGMKAERTRLDLTSLNIANVNNVNEAGSPVYKAKRVVTSEGSTGFKTFLSGVRTSENLGVKINSIYEEPTNPRLVYEPNHPFANKEGYVAYPDINVLEEMVHSITASRSYDANLTAFNESKRMINKAMDIGKA
ncbi:MAG: flagellar basal body rod protein FlgC [Firmicutes bacterium]|nr:flagellar basal body rod protein FlgC [Bacillota bacterium]